MGLRERAATRSVLGAAYLVHTPESFVRTPVAGLTGGLAVVHAAPALGAEFVWMTVEMEAGGVLAAGRHSRFFFVIAGSGALAGEGFEEQRLEVGGFGFSAGSAGLVLTALTRLVVVVIDKRYEEVAGVVQGRTAFAGREAEVEAVALGGDAAVMVRGLMPTAIEFDFAVNTMTYGAGAGLAQVEVHHMEHGLLMLEGSGVYRLDDAWHTVEAGDFIWMKAFCPQWFQASAEGAKYLIYKNWNRVPGL